MTEPHTKRPTGTGIIGQSGIKPSSTVEQSYRREFEGAEPADPRQYVPRDSVSSTAKRDLEIVQLTFVAVIFLSVAFGFILGRTL